MGLRKWTRKRVHNHRQYRGRLLEPVFTTVRHRLGGLFPHTASISLAIRQYGKGNFLIWRKKSSPILYAALDSLSRRPADLAIFVRSGQIHGDPTARCAESRLFFADRMKMVEQAAIGADPEIYTYILRAVTEGLSYDTLKMQHGIPCCRDVYYDRYRRFFWLLDKARE